MLRSVLAVVAGFLLIGALAVGTDLALIRAFPAFFDARGGTTHPGVLALMLAYVGVYATLGCYLTARLAPAHPMRHALVLGALGLAFNIIGSIQRWENVPVAWYHAIGLLTTMLWAWLGGRIRERELARGTHSRPATASASPA